VPKVVIVLTKGSKGANLESIDDKRQFAGLAKVGELGKIT
jgi:hypothetical protein